VNAFWQVSPTIYFKVHISFSIGLIVCITLKKPGIRAQHLTCVLGVKTWEVHSERRLSLLEQNWLAHRTKAEIEVAVMRSQNRVWRVQRIQLLSQNCQSWWGWYIWRVDSMVCHRRSDSVMWVNSAVRLFFDGGSEVFRKLRTPGSLKLNIKVRGRDQKLEADAKGSRGQGQGRGRGQRLRGRGQNFGSRPVWPRGFNISGQNSTHERTWYKVVKLSIAVSSTRWPKKWLLTSFESPDSLVRFFGTYRKQ